MTKTIYPNAVLRTPFEAKGITNIIQAATDEDILYIKARSQEQLDKLLNLHLKPDFQGLVVSPFIPENDRLNYQVLKGEEIDKEIEENIERFYPLEKGLPPIFGVTGTNGKTSCCWLFSEIMNQKGKNVLYLGTMGTFLNGVKKEDKIITTTPSYLELRKIYFNHKNDTDYIAIEVSSHALEQGRLGPVSLDVSAWTNFTQDHLDYHKTMENYFAAKKKIVEKTKSEEVLILPEEKEVAAGLGSLGKSVDEVIKRIKLPNKDHFLGEGFIVKNLKISLAAVGSFNLNVKDINFDKVKLPPGRFEIIENKERFFVVDYAHTPDALEKLLEQVSKTFKKSNVYVLFGCGGDRDRTKRPLMGAAADQSGYNIIITSDNPRSENPETILNDVASGIKRKHLKIVDRKEAILKAYELSKPRDVIVIAGKGHEDYQEVNGVRSHFSDQEVVRKI